MYQELSRKENLHQAFLRVKKNGGCFGIDKVSIEKFEKHLGRHLQELSRLLTEERYKPLPVRRVLIPKANGKMHPLGIPAVRDRVVQQAALAELQPVLDALFAESSFGFRPGHSAIQAVEKVEEYLKEGYEHVVDADIKDFFGTLSQQVLMAKLRRHVSDRQPTYLVWQFLTAGIMEEGKLRTVNAGTPQGGIISPILANLYLNDFDHSIEKTQWKLVRYADDFVILCKSPEAAAYAMRTLGAMLHKLKLELAEEKAVSPIGRAVLSSWATDSKSIARQPNGRGIKLLKHSGKRCATPRADYSRRTS